MANGASLASTARVRGCPACLGHTLQVSDVVMAQGETHDVMVVDYSVECPDCGMRLDRASVRVPLSEIVDAFVDQDVAIQSFEPEAFSPKPQVLFA